MKLGISEAARRAGVDRKVLYRLIEKGKLSKELEEGKVVIDLSELARLYPQATNESAQRHTVSSRPNGQVVTGSTQGVIDALKERIASLEADKADLRRNLERERTEAHEERGKLFALVESHSATLRQLTDQRALVPAPTPPPVPRRSLWAVITGQ